jgi:MULE transposase domain
VVLAENDENWEWFCQKLKETLFSVTNEEVWDRYTIMTDRHMGLGKSVETVFQGCKHSICLRHLLDNFKNQV